MNKKSPIIIAIACFALLVMLSSSFVSSLPVSVTNKERIFDENYYYRKDAGIYFNTIDRNTAKIEGRDIKIKWGYDQEIVEVPYKQAYMPFWIEHQQPTAIDACKGELQFVTTYPSDTEYLWDYNVKIPNYNYDANSTECIRGENKDYCWIYNKEFKEPAPTVTRDFNSQAIGYGEDVAITLTVNTTKAETFYVIDEFIPTGWTIANAGTGDISEKEHIKWIVITNAKDTEYNYVLTAPNSQEVSAFYGEYMFEGMTNTAEIWGEKHIAVPSWGWVGDITPYAILQHCDLGIDHDICSWNEPYFNGTYTFVPKSKWRSTSGLKSCLLEPNKKHWFRHAATIPAGGRIVFDVNAVFSLPVIGDFVFTIPKPVWQSTAAEDYNTGTGYDFNWTKVTSEAIVMPTGSDRVYVEQNQAFYDNNLMGYWRFDDVNADGSGVADDTNHGNDGLLINGADINAWGMWDTNAGFFDGVNDYVEVENPADGSLDFGTNINFTVTAWINITDDASNQNIVSKVDDDVSAGYNIHYNPGANNIRVNVTTGANKFCIIDASTDIVDTGWNHLAVVFKRNSACTTNEFDIFINGIQESTSIAFSQINTDSDLDNSESLLIGARKASGSLTQYLDGTIEEVKIYDRALTAEEILQDYNSWMTSNYYSPIKDAGDSETIWNTIEWQETTDENNSLTVDYRGCSDSDCSTAGDWMTGLSGGETAYTLHADLNRYFQYRVNFDTNKTSWNVLRSGDADKGNYAKFSNVEIFYNRLPDVNVWMVDGYDVSGAMPSFTVGDGNLTIDFNFADDTNFLQAHNVDINYSTTTTQESGTNIVTDLNVDGNFCVTNLIGGWEKDQTDAGLVGYWSFDEDDGATIFDKSGNGNIGTYTGHVNNDPEGRWDTHAAIFDGTGDFVDIVDDTSFDLTDITVTVWMKRDASPPSHLTPISKWAVTGDNREWAMTLIKAGARFYPQIAYSSTGANEATLADGDGDIGTDWIHYVFTYHYIGAANSVLKIYINGTEVATTSSAIGALSLKAASIQIGAQHSASYEFEGLLEEVKIYDRALTAQEISQDFNYGRINKRKCSWDWDITGVPDDNYYINIMSKELGYEADFDSSDNSFHVVVSAEGVCDCPPSGNWEINDGSICTLNTLCNAPADVHISSGSLNVSATGTLVLASGKKIIIEKGEFLYTEKGGKIVIEK